MRKLWLRPGPTIGKSLPLTTPQFPHLEDQGPTHFYQLMTLEWTITKVVEWKIQTFTVRVKETSSQQAPCNVLIRAVSYCKICAYRVLILSEKDWGFDQDSSVCMCVCVCVVCVWWWWGGSEGGVLPEGFSPEQFALDLVRRKDDNRTLWVKGFFFNT